MTRLAVAVIPARGGSKGVPRKNLRTVDGMPLVGRTVMAAQQAANVGVIVVSSDDPEVLAVAGHWSHGDPDVILHRRPDHLAGPDVTVAEVVDDALTIDGNDHDGTVVVLQPSSPFTDPLLIDACVDALHGGPFDSVATVAGDGHATWTADGPLHSTPKNRQMATNNHWRETGAVVALAEFPAQGGPLTGAPMVGRAHMLFDPVDELPGLPPVAYERYALDVDTPADFAAARDLATRGRVVFMVTAGRQTGSGHVHRALTLADELAAHDVRFIFTQEAERWAVDLVKRRGYPVCTDWPRTPEGALNADLVVADCLDRARTIVDECGRHGPALAAFECLDPDVVARADLLVNALYEQAPGLTGPAWEPLRPEFTTPLHLALLPGAPPAQGRVIVTMGGTDPAHLTERFANAAYHHGPGRDDEGMEVADDDRDVRVIWPPGRADECPEHLARWDGSVSEAFAWADVAVTSAGRTVLEAAAMTCATIAVCANDREVTHARLPGVLSLGHHAAVTDDVFQQALSWLLDDDDERTCRAFEAARHVNPAAATVTLAGMLDGLVRRPR